MTSARIFDIPYSGEGRFARSLGDWLAGKGNDVTLMGSGFANIKTRRLFKEDEGSKSQDHNKFARGRDSIKKPMFLYPPYLVYSVSRLFMSLLWFTKILLVHQKTRVELIHAQDTGYSGLAGVMAGRILGIPVIISSHGIRHITLASSIHGKFRKVLLGFERRLDLYVIKNADAVLVANPAIKEYFQQLAAPATRMDIIPTGIKLNDFEFSEKNRGEVRNEFGIPLEDEKMKIIGFVGRFSPEKNLFNLLTSISNIVKSYPSLRLVLVGAGPLEHDLKVYAQEKTIQNKVIFCGARRDIGRILAGLDIFVLPSYTEGLSTALLEAMASGRAIVCSDIPANHRLISQNKEGLLVNPNDSSALEKAIESLISNDALRSELGHCARDRASRYDEEINFATILQYYKSLCTANQ